MAEKLISADAFIEDIKTEIMNLYLDGKKGTPRPREELYAIIDRINEQPTVDAVEVVHCKDCKYCIYDDVAKEIWCDHIKGLSSVILATDFCSYGERRTDG